MLEHLGAPTIKSAQASVALKKNRAVGSLPAQIQKELAVKNRPGKSYPLWDPFLSRFMFLFLCSVPSGILLFFKVLLLWIVLFNKLGNTGCLKFSTFDACASGYRRDDYQIR